MEGVLLFSKQALYNYLTLQTMYKYNLGIKWKQNAKNLQEAFQASLGHSPHPPKPCLISCCTILLAPTTTSTPKPGYQTRKERCCLNLASVRILLEPWVIFSPILVDYFFLGNLKPLYWGTNIRTRLSLLMCSLFPTFHIISWFQNPWL